MLFRGFLLSSCHQNFFLMTWVTVILIIVAVALAVVGLIGAIVPGIAGPPFSYLAVLVLSFVEGVSHSVTFLVVMGVLAAVIFLVDYMAPVWGTKYFGGTQAGVKGSTWGLIIGLLVTLAFPIGFVAILVGPFVGAYIAEKNASTPDANAWKSAFGSFLGFLTGTFIKIVYAVVAIYYVVRDIVDICV